ncbi:MAG: alpha/beta hydrolase [Pseudomonadota bacterium]
MTVAGCTTNTSSKAHTESADKAGRTFVLVHGAWHGGWCWKHVKQALEADGHRVFAPTLSGLAERSHLLNEPIGLDTHVQDIVSLIEGEDLRDIVLVGHSYGGMVVTGVADHLKDRIDHIVYLDAGTPTESGQSFLDYGPDSNPEGVAAALEQLSALAPDGIAMMPLPAIAFGIPAENVEATRWVEENLTPHPLKTWTDPLPLENGGSMGLARTFILCTSPPLENSSIGAAAQLIRNDPSWNYLEMETGHDAMVLAPAETAGILAGVGS